MFTCGIPPDSTLSCSAVDHITKHDLSWSLSLFILIIFLGTQYAHWMTMENAALCAQYVYQNLFISSALRSITVFSSHGHLTPLSPLRQSQHGSLGF